MVAICQRQLYQRRLKKAFDKNVCPYLFEEGDLVLRKILPIYKDHHGKWTPNHEGPYVVKKAFQRSFNSHNYRWNGVTTTCELQHDQEILCLEKQDKSPLSQKLKRATQAKIRASRWIENLKEKSNQKLGTCIKNKTRQVENPKREAQEKKGISSRQTKTRNRSPGKSQGYPKGL